MAHCRSPDGITSVSVRPYYTMLSRVYLSVSQAFLLARTYRFATIQNVTDDRQTDDTLDRTIRKYAHGLLLESPFLPSSTDCLVVWAKIRLKRPSRWLQRRKRKQKYGGDPKNELFDPGFLFTPSGTFSLGRTVSPQYKTSQTTDRRQTTDSTVGQKQQHVLL